MLNVKVLRHFRGHTASAYTVQPPRSFVFYFIFHLLLLDHYPSTHCIEYNMQNPHMRL